MKLLIFIISLFYSSFSFCQIRTADIESIIGNKKLQVGVAVLYNDKAFCFSNDNKYPLMSVFKFHVVTTVLEKMDREHISLDSMVVLKPCHLKENTYSPLRSKYPNQNVCLSIGEVIEYTISHSDNNTCDWLIDFAGGINKVDSFMKSIGIDSISLTETEDNMHKDIMLCYNNWATPLSVAKSMMMIYENNILTKDKLRFLEKTMLECSTGLDKLKSGLPDNVMFGHKTGSSDRTPQGVKIGDNDAGVIYMPDGEKCYLTVLIKDSKESDEVNVKLMADIAKLIYDKLNIGR